MQRTTANTTRYDWSHLLQLQTPAELQPASKAFVCTRVAQEQLFGASDGEADSNQYSGDEFDAASTAAVSTHTPTDAPAPAAPSTSTEAQDSAKRCQALNQVRRCLWCCHWCCLLPAAADTEEPLHSPHQLLLLMMCLQKYFELLTAGRLASRKKAGAVLTAVLERKCTWPRTWRLLNLRRPSGAAPCAQNGRAKKARSGSR